jgi:catechol 2,3-dioxygenase-like lactoylglutathione lyase family enzyme
MRTIAVLFVLAGVPGWSGVEARAQPSPRIQEPAIQPWQVIAPLHRANLYVRSVDTSLKLYRDILKLKVVSDRDWDPRAHGLDTDVSVREVVLSAGNDRVGGLALYEIKGQKAPVRAMFLERFGHTGDVATVWSTNDIWAINDEVTAAGHVILSPPVTLMTNPKMLVQAVEMQFRDADGFLVNLLQGGIAKDSPLAASARIPDRQPEVMGTPENTSTEARIPRFQNQASGEPVHPGFRIAPMNRSTTFGRSRDDSLRFYRDTLGLTQLMSNYWKGVGINRIKNTEGLEQWAVILMAGNAGNGNIGVYQLYNEKIAFPPPNSARVPEVGDRGISLFTHDIHGLHDRYKAGGFQILTPPTAVRGGTTTEMMIRDPDGAIVTFIQPGG